MLLFYSKALMIVQQKIKHVAPWQHWFPKKPVTDPWLYTFCFPEMCHVGLRSQFSQACLVSEHKQGALQGAKLGQADHFLDQWIKETEQMNCLCQANDTRSLNFSYFLHRNRNLWCNLSLKNHFQHLQESPTWSNAEFNFTENSLPSSIFAMWIVLLCHYLGKQLNVSLRLNIFPLLSITNLTELQIDRRTEMNQDSAGKQIILCSFLGQAKVRSQVFF